MTFDTKRLVIFGFILTKMDVQIRLYNFLINSNYNIRRFVTDLFLPSPSSRGFDDSYSMTSFAITFLRSTTPMITFFASNRESHEFMSLNYVGPFVREKVRIGKVTSCILY